MADSALRYADKSVPHPDFDKVAQDIAARLRDFNGIIESVNATITSFNHSCHKLLDGDMFSGVGAKGVYTPARATCLGVDDLTVLLQASRAFDSDTYGRRGDWKFCQSVLRDTASRYQPLDKRRIFQAYLAMDTIGSVRAPAIASVTFGGIGHGSGGSGSHSGGGAYGSYGYVVHGAQSGQFPY